MLGESRSAAATGAGSVDRQDDDALVSLKSSAAAAELLTATSRAHAYPKHLLGVGNAERGSRVANSDIKSTLVKPRSAAAKGACSVAQHVNGGLALVMSRAATTKGAVSAAREVDGASACEANQQCVDDGEANSSSRRRSWLCCQASRWCVGVGGPKSSSSRVVDRDIQST